MVAGPLTKRQVADSRLAPTAKILIAVSVNGRQFAVVWEASDKASDVEIAQTTVVLGLLDDSVIRNTLNCRHNGLESQKERVSPALSSIKFNYAKKSVWVLASYRVVWSGSWAALPIAIPMTGT